MSRDLDAAIDAAVRRHAPALAGRLLPGIDAGRTVRSLIEHLHADGWRPMPAPQRPVAGHNNPDAYRRGAAHARDLLGLPQSREAHETGRNPE